MRMRSKAIEVIYNIRDSEDSEDIIVSELPDWWPQETMFMLQWDANEYNYPTITCCNGL